MLEIEICVDVPDLARGVHFYGSAALCADPFGNRFCLLERRGSKPLSARTAPPSWCARTDTLA
jgi:hypothetical protein